MAVSANIIDLAALRLAPGEGTRLNVEVPIAPITLGTEVYEAEPPAVAATIDVSRMLGGGYALHMRFGAAITGACMRCLAPAAQALEVDAREVDRPRGGEELESPYVSDERLDVAAWARDAFVLSMPAQVLCSEDCKGLCPICAADLNAEPEGHRHESAPDRRWAKLSELELE
jgi:uncharacterized protein